MEGYVGADPVRSEIVVAFRGTKSVRNWVADLDFGTDDCDDLPVPEGSDCKVHSGFNEAWNQVKNSTLALVDAARQAYPNYTVVATGHSLGGAVATIAAAHLRAAGTPSALYTFGSPRVGNQGFVDFVAAQPGPQFRVTHANDPVPRVPPSWSLLGGYRHLSPEYWLTIEDWTNLLPSAVDVANFQVCVGTDNGACNGGTDGLNFGAHSWYMRDISACSPSLTL